MKGRNGYAAGRAQIRFKYGRTDAGLLHPEVSPSLLIEALFLGESTWLRVSTILGQFGSGDPLLYRARESIIRGGVLKRYVRP